MSHVPNLLKHNGILVHYTTYPEGSVERAKALGLNLWSTYRRVESTVGLWETECQIVAKEEAWKPLGLKSQDEYIAAITGKLPSEVTEEIQARSRDKIKELRNNNPNWTQQQIADAVGCSKPYVNKVLTKDFESKESVNVPNHLTASEAKADFRKLPPELQQKVAAKEVSLNAAAIAAGIRKKPTPAEIIVKTFAKIEDRLETLKKIVGTLSNAERQVVKDWLTDSR